MRDEAEREALKAWADREETNASEALAVAGWPDDSDVKARYEARLARARTTLALLDDYERLVAFVTAVRSALSDGNSDRDATYDKVEACEGALLLLDGTRDSRALDAGGGKS